MEKVFLVEIRVKDYDIKYPGKIIGYEEVVATDECYARHCGFSQFLDKVKYSPVFRRKFLSLGIDTLMCCAPDAVEIEY